MSGREQGYRADGLVEREALNHLWPEPCVGISIGPEVARMTGCHPEPAGSRDKEIPASQFCTEPLALERRVKGLGH